MVWSLRQIPGAWSSLQTAAPAGTGVSAEAPPPLATCQSQSDECEGRPQTPRASTQVLTHPAPPSKYRDLGLDSQQGCSLSFSPAWPAILPRNRWRPGGWRPACVSVPRGAVGWKCLFEGFGVVKANRACALVVGRHGSLLGGSHGATLAQSSLPFGFLSFSTKWTEQREPANLDTPPLPKHPGTFLFGRCPDTSRRSQQQGGHIP